MQSPMIDGPSRARGCVGAVATAWPEPYGAWEPFFAFCDEAIRSSLAPRALQEADRDDCLQEIWIRILGTCPSRFRGGSLRAWLAALARNKAADVHRSRRRHPVVPGVTERPAREPREDDSFERGAVAVSRAIDELERTTEPRSFLVFYLRGREGWCYREIGAVLGLTPAQARLRHHRLVRKLRVLVGEGG